MKNGQNGAQVGEIGADNEGVDGDENNIATGQTKDEEHEKKPTINPTAAVASASLLAAMKVIMTS